MVLFSIIHNIWPDLFTSQQISEETFAQEGFPLFAFPYSMRFYSIAIVFYGIVFIEAVDRHNN